jgi:hypothetical protein
MEPVKSEFTHFKVTEVSTINHHLVQARIDSARFIYTLPTCSAITPCCPISAQRITDDISTRYGQTGS